MPYEWLNDPAPRSAASPGTPADGAAKGAPGGVAFGAAPPPPLAVLHLWPYRSLPRKGFVIFIGATAGLLTLPLLAVLGSMVLWALLPFLLAALAGVWFALQRSYRSGTVIEVLTLWPDRVTLRHQPPGKPPRDWEGNPYWIRPKLHEGDSPVPAYLTLEGGARRVELGAFLSPEERRALFGELQTRLNQARAPRPRD
ncbi:DUF2244 domain-containing protein [Phaeovulum sp. W22_SRMD_FR3]|uniref:DUF2244 domain-containing protein n=1 Tax=Phaeovulum sp. W22_SRMD_FR3 TaxID=3240274 RepID=UPI003F9B98AA